jgi:probable biosynthetic protein (TIGR04098 family)
MEKPAWNEYRFTVGMPHMVPYKLSEVELLKHLGAFQWTSVAGLADLSPSDIRNEQGERLFASMVAVELDFGALRNLDAFDEGCPVFVKNRIAIFGKKIVEGFFVLDSEPIAKEITAAIQSPEDLQAVKLPWVYMVNAFVSHAPGNGNLALSSPAAFLSRPLPELGQMPVGIVEQTRVERTGRIESLGEEQGAIPLEAWSDEPILYRLMPESDLNGAGMLYCARYIAIMNIGERIFLTERARRPLSTQLVMHLSTERRRIYYFANASPSDSLRISVSSRILPPEKAPPGRLRTVMRLVSRIDLHRVSDGVLIASSLARKAMNVPGMLKSALLEAERFLG